MVAHDGRELGEDIHYSKCLGNSPRLNLSDNKR